MKKSIKVASFWGLLGGLGFCVLFVVIYLLYQNPFLPNPKSMDFFLYLFAVVGGIVYYRFRVSISGMRFYEGFGIGLLITVLMTTISIVFIYVFLEYIDTSVVQRHIDFNVQNFTRQKEAIIAKAGKAFYEKELLSFQSQSPASLALYEVYKIGLGLVMSFVAAAVLRK
jgi:Protein of unknown function (DUF4199)